MNPEDLLTDALHDRVERTDYPSTPLSAVAGRAGAIRARRRRTTFLAAAAAVAVVTVPGAVWLGRSPGSSPEPTGNPSSQTSNPTVGTSEPPVMALNALPRGPKPDVDYLDGETFVGISGEHLSLPPGTNGVVRARGGGLMVATAKRSPEPAFSQGFAGQLALVDDPNQTGQIDLGCGAMQFAFSADGTQSAYWTMKGCDPTLGGTLYLGVLNTMGESGQAGIPTPPGQIEEPVGVLSADSVVVNAVKPDGTPDGVWVIGSGAPRRIPGLDTAQGVSESTGVVSGTQSDGTSVLVDATSGAIQWNAPEGWLLGKLSLDGAHVVASHSVGGTTRYTILDATNGHPVMDVPEVSGTEVDETAWAEDGSLMLVLDDHQSSAIVRCTIHGDLSLATPVAADGTVAHYRFSTTA
jgi:hypothetical protein